jgi:hypothetical protein
VIRVEFKLSMPGKASWDGHWSGEGKHYARVQTITNKAAVKLFGSDWNHRPAEDTRRSFSYNWSDGWSAQVTVRIMFAGEKARKSDGFAGYDWMIDSILRHGEIRT